MMMNRRKFILRGSAASAGVLLSSQSALSWSVPRYSKPNAIPVVISTWDFGMPANLEAWKILKDGGKALDAVEAGIRLTESDPANHSVGIGGYPDRDGFVTLDACIMDDKGQAGSVTFLQDIAHPISVARLVMEKTPHVMLSGEGAFRFAVENGFEKTNLLTEDAKQAWKKWKTDARYEPAINFENHDTIGMLAIDQYGNISGGCSTSGLAYKMHGRVGDSPVIGAGLYVDNEVGAAVATGLGELMMRTLSSFLVVEMMRSGHSPQQACEEAIRRIVDKTPDYKDSQAAVIALDKAGNIGHYAIHDGFSCAVTSGNQHELYNSKAYIK